MYNSFVRAFSSTLFFTLCSCLGVTIGVFVGLSNSPVVGAVTASLLGIAATVLSVVKQSDTVVLASKQMFGVLLFLVALVFGAFGGWQERARNHFMPSTLDTDFRNLISIGVSESTAREAIVARYAETDIPTSGGLNAAQNVDPRNIVSRLANEVALANALITSLSDGEVKDGLLLSNSRSANIVREIIATEIGDEAARFWRNSLDARTDNERRSLYELFSRSHPQQIVDLLELLN